MKFEDVFKWPTLYPVIVYKASSFGTAVMPCSMGSSVVTDIIEMNSDTGTVGALQFWYQSRIMSLF